MNAISTLEINLSPSQFKAHIDCLYHGIELRFHSKDQRFPDSLQNFLPAPWITNCNSPYEIYIISPTHLNYSLEYWCDESSQDCFYENNVIIQRDFIAKIIGNKILLITNDTIDDGFHNFLRWFLSEKLISNGLFVVHSSCILGLDEKAYLFLGHSGAGKTTMTKLSSPRKILGDDMNILHIKNNQVRVSAGAIGGQFLSDIGYENSVPVAGIYWLNQSNENEIIPLEQITANQKLIASFANLNWPALTENQIKTLMSFSQKVVKNVPFYNLFFLPTTDIWKLLDEKEQYWIDHVGLSMSPIIREGDQVLICPCTQDNVDEGDIILFGSKNNSELTLHRLLEKNPLLTKGDFSLAADEKTEIIILGKVKSVKRNNRVYFLKNGRITTKILIALSKLRMGNFLTRKIARVFQHILCLSQYQS